MARTANPNVERLEREVAKWLEVAGALATGYGRGAVFVATQTILATPDGAHKHEVLVPSFICSQVPDAVRRAGGTVRFYETPRDLSILSHQIAVSASAQTLAVIVPHYFGHPQPRMRDLVDTCKRLGILLIEDCALALGARAPDCRLVGTFGDLAILSFTKSDWCYGGGALTSRHRGLIEVARSFLPQSSARVERRALAYGLLRRADFLANRPSCALVAERAGRWLQRLSGWGQVNFYDQGLYASSMPAFAARRALKILRSLGYTEERRRNIWKELCWGLRDRGIVVLNLGDPGAGSHLMVECPPNQTDNWFATANEKGITLRRTWPAYDSIEPEQSSMETDWLAGRVLLLEVHPDLNANEVDRIVSALGKLAMLSK